MENIPELNEIEKLKSRVYRLLESNHKARNSSKWLVFLVYKELAKEADSDFIIPFEIFDLLPPPESITRAARYIQNTLKEFQPEDNVKKEREINEIIYRTKYA